MPDSPKHLFPWSLQAAQFVFPRALDSVRVSGESPRLGVGGGERGRAAPQPCAANKARPVLIPGAGQGAETGPRGWLLNKLMWSKGGLLDALGCTGSAAPWAGSVGILLSSQGPTPAFAWVFKGNLGAWTWCLLYSFMSLTCSEDACSGPRVQW